MTLYLFRHMDDFGSESDVERRRGRRRFPDSIGSDASEDAGVRVADRGQDQGAVGAEKEEIIG